MTVYFIQCGRGGPIKIGHADELCHRLEQLRTATWHDLFVLAEMKPAGNLRNRSKELESLLHARFAKAHIAREWFRPTAALLAFIAQHATPSNVQVKAKRNKKSVRSRAAQLRLVKSA